MLYYYHNLQYLRATLIFRISDIELAFLAKYGRLHMVKFNTWFWGKFFIRIILNKFAFWSWLFLEFLDIMIKMDIIRVSKEKRCYNA